MSESTANDAYIPTNAAVKAGQRVAILVDGEQPICIGAEGSGDKLRDAAIEAARTATNYMEFIDGTGLVIGDMQEEVLARNILLTALGMNVRNGEDVKAFFGDYVTLGTRKERDDDGNIYEIGSKSFVSGLDNVASEQGTFAVGAYNVSSGMESITHGQNNVASGNWSNAAGMGNAASGNWSNAAGKDNTASGDYSTAYGESCTTGAINSTAFGWMNRVNAPYGFAVGSGNLIPENTNLSAAIGTNLKTARPGQLCTGGFNEEDANALLVIGNGGISASTGQPIFRNAFVVGINGEIKKAGAASVFPNLAYAAKIPANYDLNDATAVGTYTCTSSASTRTLLNCPAARAFRMTVFKPLGIEEDSVVQELIDYAGVTWRRCFMAWNDTWSEWSLSTNEVITVALSANYPLTKAAATVPFSKMLSRTGYDLSLSSNGVKCARSGKVLISANCYTADGLSAGDCVGLHVYVGSARQTYTYATIGTRAYSNIAITPFLAKVSAGDVITLKADNDIAARGVLRATNNSTYLTVQYV